MLFHMYFIMKQWWIFFRLFETPEKYRKGQVQYISKHIICIAMYNSVGHTSLILNFEIRSMAV